ncbi:MULTISPECIES: site-2 protease family protein [unclassified Arthrobacter]|uniref:site-2 protease family protein n=1 Tax=unclassified Arthrobacter TaxID=235627 RepID=UPI001CFFF802|nr:MULTISPECIES: site-2 protease family protein [unclassified Arthrobacter]MCB5283283.1 putative zinc metalloprotease Rip3 [Arthrobacter sp. ES1]WGZ81137.1 site-2 protease family protein [Arthrobacter sp. EM1]
MTDTETRGRNGQNPRKQGRKEGIALGRIFGVPVILAYSWFIIAAFTVIAYGPVLQANNPLLGIGAYLVAFAYAVLLLISVLVHELAHALTARIFGWPSEKIVLNLWGGHTQFESFTASPGRSVLVAMAGPAANFVLAAAGWLLLTGADLRGVAGILANIFVWANLLIGLFNVLPGLPLDGGRLVESAVWKLTGSQEKGTVAAGWGGRIIVIALVLWFVALPLISGGRPDVSLMLITALVGSFLWMGAGASIVQARLRGRLPLVEAGALAEPALGFPESATVAELLALAPNPATGAVPAIVLYGPDGRPAGVVDGAAVATVPAGAAATTALTAVSYALGPGAYVPAWSKGQELLQYLAQLDGVEYAVVDRDGTVTGLLRQSVVLAALKGRRPGPGKRMFGQSR